MTERKQKAPPSAAPSSAKKSAVREGAPRLETPESPAVPSEETPRDEQAPLETPENPVVPDVPSEEELVELTKDDLKEEVAALDLPVSGTKAELAKRLVEQAVADAEAAEEERLVREALHVSISPVDAHAPKWVGRQPNSP